MNPFMMSNIFMGPMGMSISPMCGFGVSMPYYGLNDPFTFMNNPIFRNTTYDYLLNPMLAVQPNQAQLYTPMNMFGSTQLPLFNNFPGVNPVNPWAPRETKEEREAREAREAEEKKPENVAKKEKIEDYKKQFAKFKELTDDDIKDSEEFKELEAQYNEALKEKDINKRLEKLEEVFKQFSKETLTKLALADKDIDSMLFLIGYNFPSSTSYKHKLNESKHEVDWRSTLTQMEANLKKDDATTIGFLGAEMLNNEKNPKNRTQILQIISVWNDNHKDESNRSILRKLADYIPNNEQIVNWKAGVEGLVIALVEKADSFAEKNGGSDKFDIMIKQRTKLADLLKAKVTDNKKITKPDVLAIAKEFEKLYAMLRLQEAEVANRKIVEKYAEKMNAIKEGAIPDDIIIKETKEDLEAEGINISNIELDELPEKDRGFRVNTSHNNTAMQEIDKLDDPQKKIDALVAEPNKKLKGVANNNGVYETTNSSTNAPKKYFAISEDDKIVEVKLNTKTNKYEAVSADEVTAEEIGQYVDTISALDRYIKEGKIKASAYTKGVYLSVDQHPDKHSDVFVIRNNKLVKVKGIIYRNGTIKLNNGKETTLSQLTDDDVTEVTSKKDIYTKSAQAAAKKPTKKTTASKSASKAKETEETKNEKESKIEKTKSDNESETYKQGLSTADWIDGPTDDIYYTQINDYLNNLDSSDVFDYLAGFYSKNFYEGIIEYLDDEQDNGAITMTAKKNLITAFVEFAKSKGISESDSRIRTIELILKKYESDSAQECTTFNHGGGWCSFTRGIWNGISSIFGDSKTDNEVLDDNMKSLFNELKEN